MIANARCMEYDGRPLYLQDYSHKQQKSADPAIMKRKARTLLPFFFPGMSFHNHSVARVSGGAVGEGIRRFSLSRLHSFVQFPGLAAITLLTVTECN